MRGYEPRDWEIESLRRNIKTTTYSHLKYSILPLKRNPPTR